MPNSKSDNPTTDLANPRKLAWACRRGMLELDVILERYVKQCYQQAPAAVQQQFQQLLLCQDQELFDWLVKREPAGPQYQEIVKTVLAGVAL